MEHRTHNTLNVFWKCVQAEFFTKWPVEDELWGVNWMVGLAEEHTKPGDPVIPLTCREDMQTTVYSAKCETLGQQSKDRKNQIMAWFRNKHWEGQPNALAGATSMNALMGLIEKDAPKRRACQLTEVYAVRYKENVQTLMAAAKESWKATNIGKPLMLKIARDEQLVAYHNEPEVVKAKIIDEYQRGLAKFKWKGGVVENMEDAIE
ncbi:hypothetical protein K439DRAFT_1617910 [Ramaria rubella]|nr:hypothetical protein K439DRAFT_1617910 [Ramaria rubella]